MFKKVIIDIVKRLNIKNYNVHLGGVAGKYLAKQTQEVAAGQTFA